MIQEKEKLYIELKNILAKQNGPEVTENLVKYQQSLKERAKQLKEMVLEIKHFQSQAQEYKFEIERIDSRIKETKEHYFELRRQQVQMGVIPEMQEEDGGQDDQADYEEPIKRNENPSGMIGDQKSVPPPA